MYTPFSYQTECLDSVEAVRNQGKKQALIVMASGLGKTVTMAFDVKKFRERQKKARALFLCHNNDILSQAKRTFQKVHGTDCSYGFFHGEEKNLHNVDFLFASLQTMEKSKELFDPEEFAYIDVDESHHAQADTFRSTIEYFRPQFLLGATATPDRLDERDIRELFGQEVYYLPLEEAMARGLLTPVDYRLLTDEIQLREVLETEEGKLSIANLNRRIFIPRRDEEIAKIIARHASEFTSPRVIIFCASIRHCEHLAQFVPNSFAIHSQVPDKERAVKLEMFRQGMIGTVLTVDAFNEGIDVPQANVVVFLRSTVSQTIFLQQLGRGLRKSDGKDKVIALDFVSNCERIKMVHSLWRQIDDAATQYAAEGESGEGGIDSPMTLNVNSVEFTETIVPLFRLMDRVRPARVSEVEHLSGEYSARNSVPADRATAASPEKYWWKCSQCGHEWQASGAHRVAGSGCPACAGKVATTTNNLAVTHPKLAKQYSPKNSLPATEVLGGTTKMLWWLCADCGYEWEATGNNRIANASRSKGNGCPACSGLVVTTTNNLATKYPDLARQYSSRNELPASEVLAGGKTKRWWKCPTCEHEWQTTVGERLRYGCPGCSGRVANKFNNLAVRYPALAAEYATRNEKGASEVSAGSKKKVWWHCQTCAYEWEASPYHRIERKSGCPGCARVVVTPMNNLTVTHPALAAEYSSRNELSATEILAGTNRKVWWICREGDGEHEYQSSGNNRLRGGGCPEHCGRRRSSQVA